MILNAQSPRPPVLQGPIPSPATPGPSSPGHATGDDFSILQSDARKAHLDTFMAMIDVLSGETLTMRGGMSSILDILSTPTRRGSCAFAEMAVEGRTWPSPITSSAHYKPLEPRHLRKDQLIH